jgi:hypothetical protein
MGEEFQALVEYVEHQLLVKASMAFDATWKKKRPKKLNSMLKKMQDWEALVALHLKHITWGWHLMFQIFTTIPLLQGFLPQFPWTHNKEEALKVA